MFKKNILLLYFSFCAFVLFGQQKNAAYVSYIEKFAPVAVLHQQKYGIPASITLAQALLESQAGQSGLTARSNNHFGIKCSDWAGEVVYYDDDERQECFRKYQTAVESF
jgi:flagellum-specific peptidoglycan hydrolase FlgJ